MKLLQPIIFLLNKLKYSVKFLIVGCILIIPLFVVSFAYLNTKSKEMNQIEKRLEGADYNILLKDLLNYTQQSQVFETSILLGDKTKSESLNETKSKVNKTFNEIKKQQSNMHYDLKTKKQLEELQNLWETLQNTTWLNTEQISNEYSYLMGKIVNLMTDVTNNSDLLLAKSNEEYTLVYNATIGLPKLVEQLNDLQSIGVNIIHSKKVDGESLKQLNEVYYPIQMSIRDMLTRAAVILANHQFADELKEPLSSLENSTAKYLSEISVIEKQPATISEFNEIANKAIQENLDFYSKSIDVMKVQLNNDYDQIKQATIFSYIALILTCIIALLLFLSLYLAIKKSIYKLLDGTEKIASGDLSVELTPETNDEMREVDLAFNKMAKELKELVQEISDSAIHVAASSQQLNASTEEATASLDHVTSAVSNINEETDMQADSLHESAQAMNEMVVGIERIVKNSVKISSLTNEATQFADEGNKTVEKALQQMEIIDETVEKTSEKISDLNVHSEEINSIVRVISDIAEQTNLLALNAAIEAARAGENGKGFSVVAESVRKLAEESQESSAKIAEIIKAVQIDTSSSVEMMKLVTENVRDGIDITKDTAYKFNHIYESMQTLNPQMEEISTTTTAFSAQVEHVATSIQNLLEIVRDTSNQTSEISSSTQEQLAIMEEVATSAGTLSEMAEHLHNLVTQFKLQS